MRARCEVVSTVDWAALDVLPDRTIFQTKPWLDFICEAQGADPMVIALYDGATVIGYCTAAIVKKYGLKLIGSPLPGWTTSYLGFNLLQECSRVELADAVFDFAFKELGCVHGEMQDRRLTIEDARRAAFTYRTITNFEIDLTPPEDKIFAQMRRDCRTNIRKADREGVTLEVATDDRFADDYYAQLTDVFAKQNLRPTYSVDRVRLLVKHLLPTGNLLLVRARHPNGECIATGIYPAFNDMMVFWGGASWRPHQHLQPNEAVHWFAMKYWKARGIQVCDMGGGGEYKRKYGGREFQQPWIRRSKYGFVETLRNLAKRAVAIRQRIRVK